MTISPLRQFVLAAALWLPAMFTVWFVLQTAVVYLPIRLAEFVLMSWMPEIFVSVGQEYHEIAYTYIVNLGQVPGLPGSRLAIEDQRNNVLVFCYGLPLLWGLVMATPLSWRSVGVQFVVGFVVLSATSAFGVIGAVLKTMAFGVRPAVQAALEPMGFGDAAVTAAAAAQNGIVGAMAEHGLSLDLIALLSQFGYLVLPAVVPAALWILMNRVFIESLVGWNREPDVVSDGLSGSAEDNSNP